MKWEMQMQEEQDKTRVKQQQSSTHRTRGAGVTEKASEGGGKEEGKRSVQLSSWPSKCTRACSDSERGRDGWHDDQLVIGRRSRS